MQYICKARLLQYTKLTLHHGCCKKIFIIINIYIIIIIFLLLVVLSLLLLLLLLLSLLLSLCVIAVNSFDHNIYHLFHYQVFMPTDPNYTWLVAKLFFNNADSQVHEASSHLLYTHLTMESFCLCTHRQLSQSHPMFRLMAGHFEFLLPINR